MSEDRVCCRAYVPCRVVDTVSIRLGVRRESARGSLLRPLKVPVSSRNASQPLSSILGFGINRGLWVRVPRGPPLFPLFRGLSGACAGRVSVAEESANSPQTNLV